jgi:hypothetical protein
MKINKLFVFLFLLLLLDAAYSFYQNYQVALDGDLADNVVPSTSYKFVLEDPFGYNAFINHRHYCAPNRFWAHWTQSEYFKNIPILLQTFFTPIESIYIACALAKTLIQILLIWLIAFYIGGVRNIFRREFIISAVLITPLFQTFGYNILMGIIDISITYTFFYALPIVLVILFFLPFYNAWINAYNFKLNITGKILLFFLSIVLSYNGPLVPGIILIVCPLVLLNLWYENYREKENIPFFKKTITSIVKIPRYILVYFSIVIFLGLYSLYIGRYNTDGTQWNVPLFERYLRIPKGLYELLTFRIGFPLLLLIITTNFYFLKRLKDNSEAKRIISLLKWIGIFSLIYILLLPLGGYREYRPYIVRRDTVIPITLALFFIYGLSSYFLLHTFTGKAKYLYIAGITIFLLIFTLVDGPTTRNNNVCEKNALQIIASSNENIVALDSCNCTVMAWNKIVNSNSSIWNAELLKIWGVTKEKKLYYQK